MNVRNIIRKRAFISWQLSHRQWTSQDVVLIDHWYSWGGMSSSSSRLLIVCKFLIFALAALGLTAVCKAQGKVEIFGGYSYMHASVQVNQANCGVVCTLVLPPPTQHTNLNGWNFSGQYKFLPFLGAVADFNGTYGTLDGVGTRTYRSLRASSVASGQSFPVCACFVRSGQGISGSDSSSSLPCGADSLHSFLEPRS